MSLTDDEKALLAAIADQPADDISRLVYADWLDEHAEYFPARKKGMRDQAALIRLQVALSRDPAARTPDVSAWEDELVDSVLDMQLAQVGAALIGRDGDLTRNGYRSLFCKVEKGVLATLDISNEPNARIPPDTIVAGSLYMCPDPQQWSSASPLGHADARTQALDVDEPRNVADCGDGPFYVGGYLLAKWNPEAGLPNRLTVMGDAFLGGIPITRLPQGLSVSGNLHLEWTGITDLPDDLIVEGGMDLTGTALSQEAADRLAVMPGLSRVAKVSGLRTAGYEFLAREIERETADIGQVQR